MAQQPTSELMPLAEDDLADDDLEEFLAWWDNLTAAEQVDICDAAEIARLAPPELTLGERLDLGQYAVEHRDELLPTGDGNVFVPPHVIEAWADQRGGRIVIPRSVPRARSSRRRRVRIGSTSGRQQRDVDRPRPCGCGCGELLPAGKRKYLNDTHAARQQQRDHRAKQQLLGTPPPLTPRQRELRLWWLERYSLEELLELTFSLRPEAVAR